MATTTQESTGFTVAWEVRQLRLTGFSVEELPEVSWWEEVAGAPAEKETRNPREGSFEAQGRLPGDGHVLHLKLAPRRFDWLLVPHDDEGSSWSTLGPLEAELRSFVGLLDPWLSRTDAEIRRLALGASAWVPVESRQIGYQTLSKYLPFDPGPNAADLLYRINRYRPSRTLDDGTVINRLQTWAVAQAEILRLHVEQGGSAEFTPTTGPENFAGVEMDINTSATREGAIPRNKLVEVVNEFVDLAMEIATHGDAQ